MAKNITIRRIVPNIYSDNMARSKEFYIDFLGMELAMDMGWILTFASEENRTAQVSVFENTRKEPPDNTAIFLSVEVSDVEALYQKAKKQVWEIVYPLTDESWGVRRFL